MVQSLGALLQKLPQSLKEEVMLHLNLRDLAN